MRQTLVLLWIPIWFRHVLSVTNAPGPNDAYGNYRSSGCTSCHMVYDNSGISESLLQNIPNPQNTDGRSPHPMKHELTSAIPVDQCVHCHYQGARIGLMYQGKRESGGFKARDQNGFPLLEDGKYQDAPRPQHAVYEERGMFVNNRVADFYVEFEDDDNDGIEDTPADLHYTAGLVCADYISAQMSMAMGICTAQVNFKPKFVVKVVTARSANVLCPMMRIILRTLLENRSKPFLKRTESLFYAANSVGKTIWSSRLKNRSTTILTGVAFNRRWV